MGQILTWAIGQPGGPGGWRPVTWYQGEEPPATADVPSGCVTLSYQPEDGKPLPVLFISQSGTGFVDASRADIKAAVNLAAARDARLAEAAEYRNLRQNGGCMTALGIVDTDFARSLPLISNMAATAAGSIAAKTVFPMKSWTLADGTKVSLTPTKGVAMNAAVNAMLDVCQQAYEGVKAKINAAASREAVVAVDIAAGYPVA